MAAKFAAKISALYTRSKERKSENDVPAIEITEASPSRVCHKRSASSSSSYTSVSSTLPNNSRRRDPDRPLRFIEELPQTEELRQHRLKMEKQRSRPDPDQYPKIGYFHPKSNFIRERIPTPREHTDLLKFAASEGLASQLAASRPISPKSPQSPKFFDSKSVPSSPAKILAKSQAKSPAESAFEARNAIKLPPPRLPQQPSKDPEQPIKHNSFTNTMKRVFRSGRGRRRGLDDSGGKKSFLPPLNFVSTSSFHIALDGIECSSQQQSSELSPPAVFMPKQTSPSYPPNTPDTIFHDAQDEPQMKRNKNPFDTEHVSGSTSFNGSSSNQDSEEMNTQEAIEKLTKIVQESVAKIDAPKPEEPPTIWRRLSLKKKPSGEQLQPLKFNLPSPTMISRTDQTCELVSIPVATADRTSIAHKASIADKAPADHSSVLERSTPMNLELSVKSVRFADAVIKVEGTSKGKSSMFRRKIWRRQSQPDMSPKSAKPVGIKRYFSHSHVEENSLQTTCVEQRPKFSVLGRLRQRVRNVIAVGRPDLNSRQTALDMLTRGHHEDQQNHDDYEDEEARKKAKEIESDAKLSVPVFGQVVDTGKCTQQELDLLTPGTETTFGRSATVSPVSPKKPAMKFSSAAGSTVPPSVSASSRATGTADDLLLSRLKRQQEQAESEHMLSRAVANRVAPPQSLRTAKEPESLLEALDMETNDSQNRANGLAAADDELAKGPEQKQADAYECAIQNLKESELECRRVIGEPASSMLDAATAESAAIARQNIAAQELADMKATLEESAARNSGGQSAEQGTAQTSRNGTVRFRSTTEILGQPGVYEDVHEHPGTPLRQSPIKPSALRDLEQNLRPKSWSTSSYDTPLASPDH
ncbi:hypothetical protein V1512DRAFT_86135 [Lipomyces arxii]|uniref:uncharacterized protein n=1 Tax=Lipomyces arxii TaxID=56418 RepID=UPI0034CD11A0